MVSRPAPRLATAKDAHDMACPVGTVLCSHGYPQTTCSTCAFAESVRRSTPDPVTEPHLAALERLAAADTGPEPHLFLVDPTVPTSAPSASGHRPSSRAGEGATRDHVAGHCEKCWNAARLIALSSSDTTQPAEYQRLIAAEGHPKAKVEPVVAEPVAIAANPDATCPTCGQRRPS